MDFIKDWLNEIIFATLTAIAIFVFNKYLHPFILGVLQKTPDLTGTWDGYDISDNGTEQQKSRMEIKQLGTNISASVSRKTNKGIERVFEYHGTISSGQVLLIWKEKKSNGYNMGTMTLLLSGDLMSLKGKTTFNHHDLGKIVSQAKLYKKVST
jgi:hypothetical protein